MTTLNGVRDTASEPTAEMPQRVARGPRFDIQGLRAFAVLAVTLDHLTGWPRGGFVGVDIFFVLSGFLITGLLVREHEKTGRISFIGFYRRRIRRIIPAAVLVLVVGVAWSYFVFAEARWKSTSIDAIWALFFGSNWRSQNLATDYFAADRPPSPFQHYWSLSIEEQFYFVWPWLMLAIFALLLRRSSSIARARVVVFTTIAAITAASFVYAMAQSVGDPSSAYFSTFTRVWELGIGATLAVGATAAMKIPDAIRPLLAWIGLVGMTVSLFVISEASTFPAPWAALPVASTALVIAAGTSNGGHQQRWLWPLTNPVSNYIGDRSYSLYLWHFPIIVIGGAMVTLDSAATKAGFLVAIVVVSFYSFELVEEPIRRSHWLERTSRRSRRNPEPLLDHRYRLIAISAMAIFTVGLVALALVPSDPPTSALTAEQLAAASSGRDDSGLPALPPVQTKLQGEVVQALGATSWPDLEPTISEAIDGPPALPAAVDCGSSTSLVDRTKCTFGDVAGKHTAVMVGESTSLAYTTAVVDAFSKLGDWKVVVYATYGCPFTDTLIPNPVEEIAESCTEHKDDAVAAIKEIRPDLVLVTNSYRDKVPEGTTEPLTQKQWSASTVKEIHKFDGAAGKVVFLSPPPSTDTSLATCYTKNSQPSDCVATVPSEWFQIAGTEKGMAAEVGGAWVNSMSWFCAFNKCPAFVADIPTKMDGVHMTQAYGAHIADALLEQFKQQRLISSS